MLLANAAGLLSVALFARQVLFDDGGLEAGQRVLIVGAGGVVGKYSIALAKSTDAFVISTASPRGADAVRAAGAKVRLVRDGGVVVSMTVWMEAPYDADCGVRSGAVFVRSHARKLAELVSLVDSWALNLEDTRRIALADLQPLYAEAPEGRGCGQGHR